MLQAFRDLQQEQTGLSFWLRISRDYLITLTSSWFHVLFGPGRNSRPGELLRSREREMIMDIIRDAQVAFRSLIRSPGSAVTALVTLALGIGANAAIFRVVDGVMLRPLPYYNPDRLVSIWQKDLKTGEDYVLSGENFADWERESTSNFPLSVSCSCTYSREQLVPTGLIWEKTGLALTPLLLCGAATCCSR